MIRPALVTVLAPFTVVCETPVIGSILPAALTITVLLPPTEVCLTPILVAVISPLTLTVAVPVEIPRSVTMPVVPAATS